MVLQMRGRRVEGRERGHERVRRLVRRIVAPRLALQHRADRPRLLERGELRGERRLELLLLHEGAHLGGELREEVGRLATQRRTLVCFGLEARAQLGGLLGVLHAARSLRREPCELGAVDSVQTIAYVGL